MPFYLKYNLFLSYITNKAIFLDKLLCLLYRQPKTSILDPAYGYYALY